MDSDGKIWERFSQTVLEIYSNDVLRIDLRRTIDRVMRTRLRALGLHKAFAVVTACNPGGLAAGQSANRTAIQALESEIAAKDDPFFRTDGVSPDGSHRERGVAVCIEREVALRIALNYGQAAIFWFDGERFWIVATSGTRAPTALPAAAPLSTPNAS